MRHRHGLSFAFSLPFGQRLVPFLRGAAERNFKAVRDSVTPFIFYPVICLAMFVGILGMEENMSPITKYFSKFERPSTKSKKQSSYMAKTYFFYLIYHVIMTTVCTHQELH